jgi:hypothetical protein
MVAAWVRHMPGYEVTELQHSKKFVKKVRSAEMRQTSVITGDAQISR